MTVQEQPSTQFKESEKYDTVEKFSQLFLTTATVEGVLPTYRAFSMKSYRETFSIPDKIWAELEPIFKEKINEISAKIKRENAAKETSSTSDKVPNQYPNMKLKESPKESLIHMVSSLASLGLNESDNDTDDEAM